MKSKLLAIFAIFLVLSMPISATSILTYSISGKDNIANTIRKNDQITAEALVRIDDDSEITPDQVWLGNQLSFNSCQTTDNGYLCKLVDPVQGTKEFSNRIPYSINLHSDDHAPSPNTFSLLDKEQGVLTVDDYPPRINYAPNSYKVANSLEIDFTAFDDSYEEFESDYCSGIKEISFTLGEINEVFNYPQGRCFAQESFSLDLTNIAEGPYTVNVIAKDYFDQTIQETFEIIVDKSPPLFSNLRIQKNQEEIHYIGTNTISAIVIIDIAQDTNENTVYADFSQLGDSSNMKGRCQNSVCEFSISITPDSHGARNIIFKSEDDIGNYGEQTFSKLITQDITGPKATSLISAISFNNRQYIRQNDNTIEVTFTEIGIGIDVNNVILDLSELNGPSSLRATSCIEGWKCIWEEIDINVADGIYNIHVHSNTKDRLGNTLVEDFSQEVLVDNTPPILKNVIVESSQGGQVTYDGVVTYGDIYTVTFELFEPGLIEDAYADLSIINQDANLVPAQKCTHKESNWTCIYKSDPIDVTGYIKDNLKFQISDILGNTLEHEEQVEVFALEESLTNYWGHSVECSPSQLDKEIASIIPYKIACHVTLIGSANPIKIELDKCITAEPSVKDPELFNNHFGSKDPYISIELGEATITNSTLELKCPLLIISQLANSVTTLPEIENVSISIPFYNNPLGQYASNLQDKVDGAKDDATGTLWEIIGTLKDIDFYAQRICSLVTTINNVAMFFNTLGEAKRSISLLFGGAAGAPFEVSGMQDQTVAEFINNEMSKEMWIGGEDGIGGIVNKFCKFASCRLFADEWLPDGEFGEDLGNWQRQVLEYSNLVATAGGIVGGGERGVQAYSYEMRPDGTSTDEHGTSRNVFLQGGKLNPRDSLIISTLTLCIPGIVYNLEKYRQIQCMYADCLKTSVDAGIPIYACEDMKDYETCKYVFGELFQIAPFTGMLNYYSNLIKGILTNPLGIVDVAIQYMCTAEINTPGWGKLASICLINDMFGLIADVWEDISNFEDDWEMNHDYCDDL